MAIYGIYLRSFAPWREFGTLAAMYMPAHPAGGVGRPPTGPALGGTFHGDGRGFSLDTTSPSVTSRINAFLEVDVAAGSERSHKAWCNESHGPWMGVGPAGAEHRTGSVDADFSVSKSGELVHVLIDYAGPNPLVIGSPDIDATGEFTLKPGPAKLTIDSVITGDQFPACESFIQDTRGNKIFLGGFAPQNKDQILRLLYGSWLMDSHFESHLVVELDFIGGFQQVRGSWSSSGSPGTMRESPLMSLTSWNAQIMTSILMPSDTH